MESALSLVLALKWRSLDYNCSKTCRNCRLDMKRHWKINWGLSSQSASYLQNFNPAWGTLRQQCCSAPSPGCWQQMWASAMAFGQVSLCPHHTELGAIACPTKVGDIATSSSTDGRSHPLTELSSQFGSHSRDPVGWKVPQKCMLYKYFWDLETQATGKAGLRADSVIRICISHTATAPCATQSAQHHPAPSRSSRQWWHARVLSLWIPVLSYLLKLALLLFPIKWLPWNCLLTDSNPHRMRISLSALRFLLNVWVAPRTAERHWRHPLLVIHWMH